MTRSTLFVALLGSSIVACRADNATPHDLASRPSPSDGSPATATPMVSVTSGGSCYDDTGCSTGRSCFFTEAGCAAAGKCLVADGPRNCTVAIPMCSCKRHETFFGSGGCAGSGVREPWELYACPCATDGDCRGRQRCVPKAPSFSRPDTERECRDPKP